MLNQNASSPNFGTNLGPFSEMSSDVVNFAAFIPPFGSRCACGSNCIDHEWSIFVQQHRLQSVPLTRSDDQCFSLHRNVKCRLQPLL